MDDTYDYWGGWDNGGYYDESNWGSYNYDQDPLAGEYYGESTYQDTTPYNYYQQEPMGPTYQEMGYYPEQGPTYQELGYEPAVYNYPPQQEPMGPTYQELGYPGPQQPQQPTRSMQPQQPQQPQQPMQPQQPRQPGGSGGGLFGGLFGGGDQTQGGGFGGLLGTLGGLALAGGVGALLYNMLSNKDSGGGGGGGTISAPPPNYLPPKQLVSPGVNPGYMMGASAAPISGPSTSNLGKLVSPTMIAPINPQTFTPIAQQPQMPIRTM